MKKILMFSISLLFIGCSKHAVTYNNQQDNSHIVLAKEDTGNPPIPEVLNINHCFSKNTQKEKIKCLKIYDKDKRIPKVVSKIYLASSRAGVDTITLNLNGRKRLLIHADKTNVKENIYTNIPNTIIYRDSSHTITFDINVKDIKDKVKIYDGEDKLLIEYIIIR